MDNKKPAILCQHLFWNEQPAWRLLNFRLFLYPFSLRKKSKISLASYWLWNNETVKIFLSIFDNEHLKLESSYLGIKDLFSDISDLHRGFSVEIQWKTMKAKERVLSVLSIKGNHKFSCIIMSFPFPTAQRNFSLAHTNNGAEHEKLESQQWSIMHESLHHEMAKTT